jgi:hypothetical protein
MNYYITLFSKPWALTTIIIITIILIITLYIWIRRYYRIKSITIKTGPADIELERKRSSVKRNESDRDSVNISGNMFLGKNQLSIHRDKTTVEKTIFAGENKVNIGTESDTPTHEIAKKRKK